MISLPSDRKRRKAVPQTSGVMVRFVLSLGIGLAVLVTTILRWRDMGTISTANVVIALVGLFLVGLSIFIIRDLPAARKLDRQGQTTEGKVVAKWTKTDADDDRDCFLAYAFGDEQEAFQKVSVKDYRQYEIGDAITVVYLPEDPTLSRLDDI
jgi:hypothetical protein